MNILSSSKRLLSSVFRRSVLMEQALVFRSIGSVPKARCVNLRSAQRLKERFLPCQHGDHVTSPRRHRAAQRPYSQLRGGDGRSNGSTDVSREEAMDQRTPETFTLDVLVSLLRQENAVDICVVKVPDQIKYTEYFLVVSGVSTRHIRAMALYALKVFKFLRKRGAPSVKIEGKEAEDWMCIDFGNMVVHFMLPETREVYELEKLWTLRMYDEQLNKMPIETLPEDFIYDAEDTK
ncbi:mitochondrial assembly of ribosomal large subunit protein 1 [Spinachia spinachia]